jgi:peptidoglycan-associated lipoprotein
MRKINKVLSRLLVALLLLALVATLTGCSRSGPRSLWKPWTWLNKSQPRIYPDEVLLPQVPDTQPIQGPGGDNTSIAETDPVRSAPSGLVSELQTIFFSYDSYELSPETLARIQANAEWVKSHPGITIQVEGHCDERGSVEYNLNLGQKRADTVRENMIRMGVDASVLTTISYGEERPTDTSGTEEGMAKNRRVQFLIY